MKATLKNGTELVGDLAQQRPFLTQPERDPGTFDGPGVAAVIKWSYADGCPGVGISPSCCNIPS